MTEFKTWRRPHQFKIVIAAFAILVGIAQPAPRVEAMDNFVDAALFLDEFVVTVPTHTLSGDWLPDGRLLAMTKYGQFQVINPISGTATWAGNFSGLGWDGERGALDLVLDPNFADNHRFFVFYTSDSQPAEMRIARFQFFDGNPATVGNMTQIWANPGPDHVQIYHAGGSLNISNGKLILTVGDGQDATQSASLNNVFGKVIRLNLDGSIPSDNPFVDGGGPNLDEIYAYGLRNPFRSWIDPVTGIHWVGDVGGNTDTQAYEEVNQIVAGANYGWPSCEGPLGLPKNGPVCPAGVTAPWLTYSHTPGGGSNTNASITGGEIARSDQLPGEMNGAYIYGDWASDKMFWVEVQPNGSAGAVNEIPIINLAKPVWVSIGPDGHIYYLRAGWDGDMQLRRVRYTGELDGAPVIDSVSATPTTGIAPLVVQFSTTVTDPDGDPITYAWDFGDGQTSTQEDPAHTYSAVGTYQARLVATANGANTASSAITISVGGAPTVSITSPINGSMFTGGDDITLSADGVDLDGPLLSDDYEWTVELLHNAHRHPTLTSAPGNPRLLNIATTGHDYRGSTGYRISVTVTDQDSLTATDSVEIFPNKVDVTFTNNLSEGQVVIDGVTNLTPFVLDSLIGFQHDVGVPDPLCVSDVELIFNSWSDGGALFHQITVPNTDVTFSATYVSVGACGADNTPPFVVSPEPNVFVNSGSPVTVSGTISDDGSPLSDLILQATIIDIGHAAATGVNPDTYRYFKPGTGVPGSGVWTDGSKTAPLFYGIPIQPDGTWSVTYDPAQVNGSVSIGLRAFDAAGNKWPAAKPWQAVVVLHDPTRPTATASVPVDTGTEVVFSGSMTDDKSPIRKGKIIVAWQRIGLPTLYWNGTSFVVYSEANPDVDILRQQTALGSVLGNNTTWSFSVPKPGASGTLIAVVQPQNGSYQLAEGVFASIALGQP